MTPLKVFILSELLKFGSMRDVELWQHTKEVTIEPIKEACRELEAEGYIQRPESIRPLKHEWQLTEPGRSLIAYFNGNKLTEEQGVQQ